MIRLYTEDTEGARRAIADRLESATLVNAEGIWRGTTERSLIVHVAEGGNEELYAIAGLVGALLGQGQECILLSHPLRGECFATCANRTDWARWLVSTLDRAPAMPANTQTSGPWLRGDLGR